VNASDTASAASHGRTTPDAATTNAVSMSRSSVPCTSVACRSARPIARAARTAAPRGTRRRGIHHRYALCRSASPRVQRGRPAALQVPRAARVVACGGGIVYSGGFGRTAAGDPVDPARTLFRAASNAKLVAATAVMQLAEQGAWRLEDDVNTYLPERGRIG